jgi:formate dehydrogenase subunit delta
MSTVEKLVYMANQIAANLAAEDDPVEATAHHIRLFWDPRMKQMILAHDGTGLSPNAASAVAALTSGV